MRQLRGDRVGAGLLREEHVPALLVAAGAARRRLDPDLPVEDGLRGVVERGEVEEIALRALPVQVLEAVHVDALRVARSHEPEQLHGRSAGLDVRLDARLRAAAADEDVERREVAVPPRAVALRPEVPDVLGEAADADVADLRALARVDLEERDREPLAGAGLRREILDQRDRRPTLGDDDRPRDHGLLAGRPRLLEDERHLDLDVRRHVEECAPGRPQRARDRAEGGMRRHALRRGVEPAPHQIGMVERRAQQPLEDDPGRRRVGLEAEGDARKMIERRDERAGGHAFQGEPPPLLLFAGRPGLLGESGGRGHPRRAQPGRLAAPLTELLDRVPVEQQRDAGALDGDGQPMAPAIWSWMRRFISMA
jgi:hypothetical protein